MYANINIILLFQNYFQFNFVILLLFFFYFFYTIFRTSENAACNNNDENDMKEEVYQDLCSIQRASRHQVGIYFVCFNLFLVSII